MLKTMKINNSRISSAMESFLSSVLFFGVLLILSPMIVASPSPFRKSFEDSGWLERIPTIKVGTDGIALSTGPSRDEVYWMVAYVIIGFLIFILISIAVGLCIYKCCSTQRSVNALYARAFMKDSDLSHSRLVHLPGKSVRASDLQRILPIPETFKIVPTAPDPDLPLKSMEETFSEQRTPHVCQTSTAYRSTN